MEVEQIHVVHGLSIPLPPKRVECDIEDIIVLIPDEEEMDPKAFKLIGALTLAEKRFFLKACCGNETCYAVNAEPGKMLHDADMMMIFEWVQWQYLLPEVTVVRPALVKMAMHFGTSQIEGRECLLQIKEAMLVHEFAVLPVHSDYPLHWTVLVVQSDLEKNCIVGVKYYDWLGDIETSAKLAQLLLTMISVSEEDAEVLPLKLPAACNHFRQRPGSNDCGFALWQALENCFKKVRGEGEIGVLPKPITWRNTLKTLLKQLVTQQDKWLLEEGAGGKPKHPICLPGTKKVGAEADKLKLKRNQYYCCGSCRYTASGDGCCYCNPAKFEKLAAEKEKRARAMANAVEKALKKCREMGLISDPVPPVDPKGPLKGGSSEGTSFLDF